MSDEYKKFYEMDLWKKAQELQKKIFELTKNYPRTEEYGLISQSNRSTASVLANLAEAHGRYHFADKIRVLYIVRGEIEETQSHLIVATSRNYISKNESTKLIKNYEEVKMKVNNYISSLYRQNSKK